MIAYPIFFDDVIIIIIIYIYIAQYPANTACSTGNSTPPTNCDLDPVPTRLLKEQLNCIIPLMVDIVNKSLCSGVFPDCLKQAIVVSLLKKKSLDKNVYSNYRPVSNLAFLSNKLVYKY